MSTSTPVFSKQYVEKTASSTNETISSPIRAQGNRAVLNATIRNISLTGTVELKMQLQGSYDGKAWEDAGANLTVSAFGNDNVGVGSSGGTFDYAWVRVSVQMSSMTTNASIAILDANVVFSQQ